MTNNSGAVSADLPSSRILIPTGLDNADERLAKVARRGWRAIDRVMAIPQLPTMPVEFENNRNRNGLYQSNAAGDSIGILLSRGGNYPALTAIHEYGHYLDHQALTRALALPRNSVFASESGHDTLVPWRTAVEGSAAFRRLLAQCLVGTPEYRQGQASGISQHHLEYLTQDAELWARTFTQWVVTRSGDATFRQYLYHATTANRVVYYQWSEEDFGPIAEAIDTLFADLGWQAPQRRKGKRP